jgi:hypothetical protein
MTFAWLHPELIVASMLNVGHVDSKLVAPPTQPPRGTS